MHFLAIFFGSILFIYFLLKLLSNFTSKKLPPSPTKLPFLGHLHKLGSHPHISLQSLAGQYGDLMLIYLGSKPTVVASSAKMMKEITKTHDSVMSSRMPSSIMKRLVYNGVDVAQSPMGESWRQLRSVLVHNLLSNKRVHSIRNVREEEVGLVVKNVEKNVGSALNMSSIFMELTNDVVSRAAFGMKYSEIQVEGVDFKEVLMEFMELVGSFPVGEFLPWLGWVNKLNGIDERIKKVATSMDKILEAILEAYSVHGKVESVDQAKNFILADVLLETQRDNSAGFTLEKDHIKAMLLDVFIGGTETGSTATEWAMSELLRNPSAMKKLQKEVREIGRGNDLLTEDDFGEMKYLKAVVKETFRLHPPIPLLMPHLSMQDVEIDGYHIPANSMILLNAWTIMRDPKSWDDANEFRPERFLNSSIDYRGQNYELVPFGSGRRVCPGIQFAVGIIELVLANLMNKFDWKLPDGVEPETMDMKQSPGFSIRRKNPLLAVATPVPVSDL